MSQTVARVAIIGAGLSGLYAAHLLSQAGVHDHLLLEARDEVGGRIRSVLALAGDGRFDLGATWFWPEMQPEVMALVEALGLAAVPQHEDGDLVWERSASQPPVRVPAWTSAPPALRLAGGMGDLVDAVRAGLREDTLHRGCRVTALTWTGEHIAIEAEDAAGQPCHFAAARVLLALPPRLAAQRLRFTPDLPDALTRAWTHCATWMAPHAKYLAVYDRPFWRAQGLSGGARAGSPRPGRGRLASAVS